jgi:hypothetical protein
MRKVAYALFAFAALTLHAPSPASAGCYGECNGYRDYGGDNYDRYDERPTYRSSSYYDNGPRYHTTYYVRGPEYQTGYYERPVYRSSRYYDDGYYDRSYRRYSDYSYDRPYRRYYGGYSSYYDRPYYRRYGYGYDSYYPTVRYGGGWSQTAYGYGAGWGGCHSAYIPYGWTWYRAHSC